MFIFYEIDILKVKISNSRVLYWELCYIYVIVISDCDFIISGLKIFV